MWLTARERHRDISGVYRNIPTRSSQARAVASTKGRFGSPLFTICEPFGLSCRWALPARDYSSWDTRTCPQHGDWEIATSQDRLCAGSRSDLGTFSDPIPVRVRQIVGLVHRNGGTIALKWPGEGAGEGQMGNVGLVITVS